jgi:hypothetical protein
MRILKLISAVAVIGFTTSTMALAACPPQGCPRGYACAGNPIFSTCVPIGDVKTKQKSVSERLGLKPIKAN